MQSGFHHFAKSQVLIRQIVKTEFILGIAELLINTIKVYEYQHIHEKMSEIIVGLETMKALLEKSENDAALDEYGYLRPAILPLKVAGYTFSKIYARLTEIIQLIGAAELLHFQLKRHFTLL